MDLILVGLAGLFGFIAWYGWKANIKLREELAEARTKGKGADVKLGTYIENYFPFMKDFPEPENFKHLGQPVDGVSFNTDKIIFWEFKTGKAQKNPHELEVKALIDAGKVEYRELRI